MIRRAWALAALLLALACAPALAAPVTVNLRVEGKDTTIFEGRVRTDGHAIEQDAAGPKPCDGTNGGAHPTPGPTMTSALDDGLAWDGAWTESLQDFQIDRIGPDRADVANNRFWGYALNFTAADVGGCQQQVKSGDKVLYVFDFFSKTEILRLSGPKRVEAGRIFRVTVVDGRDGKPVENARVGGSRTNRFGKAVLRAPRKGTRTLKAEHAGSVRSNALNVRAV